MAKQTEFRPSGNGWSGLQLHEAPLNLDPGALLEAKDVVIRAQSLVEQRPGLAPHTLYGGSDVAGTTKLYPSVSLNTKRRASLASSNADKVFTETLVSTLLNTQTNFHVIADAEEFNGSQVLFASGRNHWGYPLMNASAGTAYPRYADQPGMNMGDSRFVNGIFTTQNTPGVLREMPQEFAEYPYETGKPIDQVYSLYSDVLGVASTSYVEATVAPSTAITGMWYESNAINSWAYRSVMKRDASYGKPSPREIFVTPVLPKLTVGTITAVTNAIDVAVTSPVATGVVVGQVFEVKESSNPLWVGQWKVQSVQSATAFTVRITGTTATTTATIAQWRVAVQSSVRVYRPKEQSWSGHYTEAMFGFTPEYARTNVGDYHTRVFFQQGSFELYRTNVTSSTIEVGVLDPGDEMFQVSTTDGENNTVSLGWTDMPGELYLTYADSKSDGQLGKFLYTNPSQEGIAAGNDMPPSARILENYKNTMFWANVKVKNTASFQIGALLTQPVYFFCDPDTLPSNDGVGFTLVFTPTTAENIGNLEFGATVTGNPAADIEAQARSLVRVINANPRLPLKARYVSDFSDEPGKIEVTYLDYATGSILVASTELNTKLVVDTKVTTTNLNSDTLKIWPVGKTKPANIPAMILSKEVKTNRIHWSKTQKPGAAPLAYSIDLPERVNIIALRTTSAGMYVVTDSGIWMLSGTEAPWDLREHDMGAKCWSQGAVNSLADTLFVLTTQGLQMYGNGEVISHPVNKLILPVRQQVQNVSMFSDTFRDQDEPWISSAIDENNQEYLLFLPKLNSDIFQVLRYNLRTGSWTTMDRNLRCGLFNKSSDANVMMYGDADTTVVLKERKGDELYPFCDEQAYLNDVEDLDERVNADGTYRYFGKLTISDDLNSVIKAGDHVVKVHYKVEDNLFQWYEPLTILKYEAITLNGAPSYDFTVSGKLVNPSAGVIVQFVRSFDARVGLVPFSGGDATLNKKWTTVHTTLLSNQREVTLEVQTDQHRQPTQTRVETINPEDGWGSSPFGVGAWGNETNNPLVTLDTYVPRVHQVDRTLQLTVENSGFNQDMKVQNVAIDFDSISKRSK